MCPVFYGEWAPWFCHQVKKQLIGVNAPYEVIVATHLPERLYKSIPNLVFIKTAKNCSIGRKRNIICERAKYKYILAVDDDDFYPEYRLSLSYKILSENPIRMLSSDKFLCYNLLDKDFFLWNTFSESCLFFTKEFWQDNPFFELNICEGNGLIDKKESFYKSDILLCLAFTHDVGRRQSKHKLALPTEIKSFPFFDDFEKQFLLKRFNFKN